MAVKIMADYIKRSDALRPFVFDSDGTKYLLHDCDNFPIQIHLKDVQRTLRKIPAADVRENVRGEWIKEEREVGGINGGVTVLTIWRCSNCDEESVEYPFCPFCGADMRGGDNNDKR